MRVGYSKLNSHFACPIGDDVNAYLERHPNLKRHKGKATKTGATDVKSAGGALIKRRKIKIYHVM